ncbi:N-acetylneuraminate synthase family protein [Candidatus Margulisiibacteriota bacterium]
MQKIKLGKNKFVGDGQSCFIIAEVGSNHDGDFSRAKQLIEIAAEAKVDAVKFQLFSAKDLYPENCGEICLTSGKVDLFKSLKDMELPALWLKKLKKYAEKCGLEFICTPFSEQAAKMLYKSGTKIFKIASPELSHLFLIKYLAKFNLPIIMSTGISKLADIEEAVETCKKNGNEKIALLHCVSAYPAPLADCNLNVIKTLKMAFACPVGLSDHTMSPDLVPAIAVALGANLIEKHFTISRKLKGLDHGFALEPKELAQMVKTIRQLEQKELPDRYPYIISRYGKKMVNKIAGQHRKTISPSEELLYACDRRSLRVVKTIKKGGRVSENNILALRSERNLTPGIHPRYWELVLGKKSKKDGQSRQ